MRKLVVDVRKLEAVVQNPRVVRLLAERFARPYASDVIAAEVGMFEHPDGALVKGRPGRWWVYVRLLGKNGEPIYDIAVWKLLVYPETARQVKDAVIVVGGGTEVDA